MTRPAPTVTVPIEPTEAMKIAGVHAIDNVQPNDVSMWVTACWSAMITAAPAAPQAAGVGKRTHPTGEAIQDAVIAGFLHGVGMGPWDDMHDYIAVCARDYVNGDPLPARAPSREPEGGAAHYGDPCVNCGVGHDNVPQGPCRGDGITISRERANALLGYLKNGSGPAGWPTTLWCEVQAFIKNIEAALATREEAPFFIKEGEDPVAFRALGKVMVARETPAEAGDDRVTGGMSICGECGGWGEHLSTCARGGFRAQPRGREDAQPVALPPEGAPRDGTMLRLRVRYEAANQDEAWTPLEDSEESWTIGFNNFDNTGDDRWQFVGWDWSQDHLLEATGGAVIGWLPFHTHPAPDAQPVGWLRAADEEMVCAHLGVAEAGDSYETAKKKLVSLIQWNIAVATDPSVGGHPAPDALRAAVEALEPFAERALRYVPIPGVWQCADDVEIWQLSRNEGMENDITVGHLRRAYETLAALQAEQGAK